MSTVFVDYEEAKMALLENNGCAPSNPKATVALGEPDADGQCELIVVGDPHASAEAVATSLGLQTAAVRGEIAPTKRPEASQAFISSAPGRTSAT
jgi:hypothetical protein